ncbi:hypothetical protein AAY81_05655 [Denitrobacterium detoxificans]|uniref:Zinc-ribbon domain-containing protein n=1 Tax=Denitrobacterium detoxificans TaxID=79604 RepID=A0A172RYF2_9ACTN|nr:FHA domain-containing protein [Denitrobacterium detoxificans]ANE22685.1 hypothetical protein AAY81_05655 [Denitrobacterium detoxificans]SEO87194.1 zinc-ribbon domain-containing protein [Denitrobacterium detoxificans]
METCPVCNGPVSPQDAACPSCGFKLTGSTQKFQPINLNDDAPRDKQAAEAKVAAQPSASFTVVRGPQQIDTKYSLEARELTIGRSPKCDIFLNDMTVSRHHAVVMPVGDRFAIRDEDSFNGVWINNENVTQRVLEKDDIVQIGAFCLLYSE